LEGYTVPMEAERKRLMSPDASIEEQFARNWRRKMVYKSIDKTLLIECKKAYSWEERARRLPKVQYTITMSH
jgi:hypothetical protein